MFQSILTSGTLTISSTIICIGVAILLGLIIAYVHKITSKYSKNFLITLAVLPTLVQIVIFMVNGNLGTSVAVLGAFSLVRFRSIPGNSKEIISIFFAMAIGLAVGMGQVFFAVLVTIVLSIFMIILAKSKFGEKKVDEKKLKITIPENMDYTNVFDDIFSRYLDKKELNKVKTTNMGSMYELSYNVILKESANEKQFIDEIRCRNGNLNIILGKLDVENEL